MRSRDTHKVLNGHCIAVREEGLYVEFQGSVSFQGELEIAIEFSKSFQKQHTAGKEVWSLFLTQDVTMAKIWAYGGARFFEQVSSQDYI